MTVEIRKVKEAKFYLSEDLRWLNKQINDERAQGFQAWVDRLDFGVPQNLKDDIAAYQKDMKPYFDGLIALRDKLQAELDGIDTTIAKTVITVTEEVQKYLVKEEVIEEPIIKELVEEEPDDPITKG